MTDFGVMQYAAGAMDAQHSALDVLARNVATAETAGRTHPVHPLIPRFAVASDDDADDVDDPEFAASLASFAPPSDADDGDDAPALPGAVTFAGATPSPRAVTGIDAVTEMVSVLGAQRAFEANATVFDTGKRLIQRTIDVENAS